jgi:flagellar biogenesis protein FliO
VKGLAAALLLAAVVSAAPDGAAEQVPPRAADGQANQPIPFRKDDSVGAMAMNVGLGLIVAIGAGVGALYLLRRYLAVVQKAPGRRLRVIETIRLGPKSALFLVELDGRSLLIGQHGETLAVLAEPPPNSPLPADRV